jgi:hypothetical protein
MWPTVLRTSTCICRQVAFRSVCVGLFLRIALEDYLQVRVMNLVATCVQARSRGIAMIFWIFCIIVFLCVGAGTCVSYLQVRCSMIRRACVRRAYACWHISSTCGAGTQSVLVDADMAGVGAHGAWLCALLACAKVKVQALRLNPSRPWLYFPMR